ncbi:hypothetical protein [Nonomuraea sp. KM90]|uniref:hypothetical protein n=1 Tax=Nonomuraea sp. KM90 TaxID=3457428 RepID=UPI003FCE8985
MSCAPADIVGSWLHSYEEDSQTTAVYRPPDHPFPPSRRVRRGLEFRADGAFVDLRPGPDDRPRPVVGRWRAEEWGRIRVAFPSGRDAPLELTVVSCAHDVLVLAK